ncbi:MAG: hypothetical protein MJE68_05260, partial [Proteobacteria bacterium]|nr:hypothetical protein [Pseudomonadota bacterium]
MGATGEAPQPAALPVPTPSSAASIGPSAATETAGTTAVVAPIAPDRQNLPSVWRAQIDEMRRRKQRLEEEDNT